MPWLYRERSIKLDKNAFLKSREDQNVLILDNDLKSPDFKVVVDLMAEQGIPKKCTTLSATEFAKIKADPALTLA